MTVLEGFIPDFWCQQDALQPLAPGGRRVPHSCRQSRVQGHGRAQSVPSAELRLCPRSPQPFCERSLALLGPSQDTSRTPCPLVRSA